MEKKKEIIVLIDDGNLFEGTFEQFEDCFFYFSEGSTREEKLEEISNWCNHNKYKFSWSYELTPYKKEDGSTWLGNKKISD